MSLISLLKAWREYLLTGCPVENWDKILEEYGENEAASKFRLDTQIVRHRYDCQFYGIATIDIADLAAYAPDKTCCDIYLEECQIRLNDLAPAISLKEL